MNELITIKGSNNGLQLCIAKGAGFTQVRQALSDKLAASANFFIKNTPLYWSDPLFTKEQQQILTSLCQKYHLLLQIKTTKNSKATSKQKSAGKSTHDLPVKVINRTIRGGEEISYQGSITIHGNVNPGAKIVAGGNIDIHGGCRGVVHAGAFGDTKACIIADNLTPLQIRIAGFIARSPDNVGEHIASTITEKAIVKDGNIVLEPFTR